MKNIDFEKVYSVFFRKFSVKQLSMCGFVDFHQAKFFQNFVVLVSLFKYKAVKQENIDQNE